MLDLAIEMAKEAGAVLREKFGNLKKVERKGVADLLTDADLAADTIITIKISKRFPNHNIVSEESEHEKTDSKYTWYIDPLDGTLNFAAEIPLFTTSIGLAKNGEMIVGVVYNPVTNELFTAEKGKGAFLNGKKITVSQEADVRNVLVATPIDRSEDQAKVQRELKIIEKLIPVVRGIRIYNAAAYELCSLASGKFGAMVVQETKPWDIAAGTLIVEEAGGRTTTFEGKEISLADKNIVWSNGVLHDKIVRALQ